MLRLSKLTFEKAPRIPGVRPGDISSVDLDNPAGSLLGWTIAVRTGYVYFISPPGWTQQNATSPHVRDPKGTIEIHEVPRANVYLHWAGAAEDVETVLKGGKFDTLPLGPKPTPVTTPVASILAQLPA